MDAKVVQLHPYKGRIGGLIPEVQFSTKSGRSVLKKLGLDRNNRYQLGGIIQIAYLEEDPRKTLILPDPSYDVLT